MMMKKKNFVDNAPKVHIIMSHHIEIQNVQTKLVVPFLNKYYNQKMSVVLLIIYLRKKLENIVQKI